MGIEANSSLKGYELRERVGAGSSGMVYRAYQPAVAREVAIKLILPEFANQPDFVRRFEVEAQLIARLEHPHIVPLYDYWRDPDGAYLVMRWLPGNLRTAIERGAWLPSAAARLLEQLAAALTVAHRDHIVHRDIKPDNILLDEDENAYLADFSIARDLSLQDVLGSDASTSPAYSSPEQIKREPLTARTDIYCLGFVLYELLSGESAFPDATTPEAYRERHLHVPLPPLSSSHAHIPAALDEVLQTATAKDPAQRYASAQRFAAAFRAALPTLTPVLSPQPIADPLTPRELDVLRLMVTDLTNEQIATKLFLSPGTIKWNVKQIYSKLDVHTRADAIERAKRLKLVESPTIVSPVADIPPERKQPDFIADPVNPYKGLRSFQEADAPDFFGRAALVERLLNRLAESSDDARLLVVVGPSGSGKSSLVKAGLLPALRRGALTTSPRPFIAEMLPGTHPLEELEAALLHVAVNQVPGLLDQLREDRRGLVRATKRVLPSDPETELILVVDQFEELFTLVADEAVRAHFIDTLLAAVTDPRGRVRVLLTLRADFYDRPLLYPRLGELMRTHTEVVLPLSARELEQAIQGPAERVGVQLEAGLVTTLVNQVGEQPGALPLLEYALTELFERRDGLTLTLDAYGASGGVLGALASRADELYDSLDEYGKTAVRQVFLRLITLGEGVEDTRRRVLQAELSSLLDENHALDDVIDLYSQFRLLTLDRDPLTRGPTVEIAHEALIREWGRLRDWLNDSRDALRVQRRLMTAAEDWLASGKEASYLASGARLTQFEALADEGDLRLNEGEREYLNASTAERKQQVEAERERQANELLLAQQAAQAAQAAAKSQRQSANRLRYLVTALALFLLIAAGLSVFAFNSRSDALTQRQLALDAGGTSQANFNRAEAQRLADESNSVRTQHLSSEVAALLAVRSMRLQYSVDGDEALANAALLDLPVQILTGNTDISAGVAYSPDGRYLLNASNDGTVRLWDAQTGKEIRRFTVGGLPDGVSFSPDGQYFDFNGVDSANEDGTSLRSLQSGAQIRWFPKAGGILSPDGRYLLTDSDDDIVRLLDVHTGQEVQRYVGHTAAIEEGLAFFLDGQHIITGSLDRTVRVWDTLTGKEQQRLTLDNGVMALALAPDTKSVLVGGAGGLLQLWDLQSAMLIRSFSSPTSEVHVVGFLPDGLTAYSSGNDYIVRLWDVATGEQLRQLVGHTKSVNNAALSPDGQHLASSSQDDTLRIWNLRGSAGLPQFNSPGQAENFNIAVSPDGNEVLTGGVDHSARLWDTHSGQLIRQFTGNSDSIFWVAFSPDGRYALAGGSSDDVARLWDIQTGQQVRQFPQSTPVNRTVFSPDGKLILTNSLVGGAMHLWDAQTGQELFQLPYAAGVAQNDATFSPDSRSLVTTSFDGTARLWDTQTGQQIRVFNVPSSPYSVAYMPDGKTFFTGGNDGFIRQWDVQTGQQLQQFVAHSDSVNNLALSPDGRYLLSGGDTTAKLWDTATGQLLRTFVGHTAIVSSVAFFPDGKHVLSGDISGVAREWDVDYHDTINSLCARLLRDFTDDERAQFNITDTSPTCPADGEGTPTLVAPTWTPVPTGTIPVWTPLPLTPLPADVPATPAATTAA